ncbi:reverse transcriptase domain-containing protein [Tanacetum coccineum]
MRTHSQIRNRPQQQVPPNIEPFNLEDQAPPVVTLADQRTMAQLLQAPTEGYEDAIVVPAITADNFELKHGLLTLVQNKPFCGLDKEDPHAHIRYFNKITSTQFFPLSKTTNIQNEITNFRQRFDESFSETWDLFKDLLRACPHHGFLELHQLDTLYNALNSNDQDSLNSATGGNFLDKMPRDCLAIIESKSKVRYSRSKTIVSKVGTSPSTPSVSPDVAELKDMVRALLLDKKNQSQAPATIKAVEESCVTCGGAHSYSNCPATDGNVYHDNIQEYISQAIAVNYNQGNTVPPLPSSLPKVVEHEPEVTKDTVQPSTKNIQPLKVRTQIDEPVVAPKTKPTIPYPSRINKEKLHEKDDLLALKFMEMFRNLHFELSFADALLHMLKFAPMFRKLLNNKDKIIDLIKTSEKLNLLDLTKTRMILELADRMISTLTDIVDDVFVKVGTFLFMADFVVVDYIADPQGPLILRRPFLRTARALIDVHGEQMTLQHDDQSITFKVGDTKTFSYNTIESVNRVDVIDVACEEFAQEVLGFSNISKSGNPTPTLEPILSTSPTSLTPFEGGDFILEEIEACLTSESIPPGIDDADFDPKEDLLTLERLLNSDPTSTLPPEK